MLSHSAQLDVFLHFTSPPSPLIAQKRTPSRLKILIVILVELASISVRSIALCTIVIIFAAILSPPSHSLRQFWRSSPFRSHFSRMAWRSSGISNEELVSNLHRNADVMYKIPASTTSISLRTATPSPVRPLPSQRITSASPVPGGSVGVHWNAR